jgi:hypothetical protein
LIIARAKGVPGVFLAEPFEFGAPIVFVSGVGHQLPFSSSGSLAINAPENKGPFQRSLSGTYVRSRAYIGMARTGKVMAAWVIPWENQYGMTVTTV